MTTRVESHQVAMVLLMVLPKGSCHGDDKGTVGGYAKYSVVQRFPERQEVAELMLRCE